MKTTLIIFIILLLFQLTQNVESYSLSELFKIKSVYNRLYNIEIIIKRILNSIVNNPYYEEYVYKLNVDDKTIIKSVVKILHDILDNYTIKYSYNLQEITVY